MAATTSSKFTIIIIFFFSILTFSLVLTSGDDHGFARTLDMKTLGLKKEKLSHFRIYWHDILTGRHPSAVQIVPPVANSSNAFGMMRMIDNPLTQGPELSSKLVGRAQGFYMSASQHEFDLLMAMNFAFIEGKYNGSTIIVLGRNTVFSMVREMPVIGGTGAFRFARGYVQLKTIKFDPISRDATVQYDCHVLHY